MGFLKIYGANIGPNAKILRKKTLYVYKFWSPLVTLYMPSISLANSKIDLFLANVKPQLDFVSSLSKTDQLSVTLPRSYR